MRLGAVILAAGSGSRLGGVAKALLRSGSQTFLERIAETARAVGLDDAIVVVGPPFGDAVAMHAHTIELATRTNPDPARGMASSVAIGFAALAASPEPIEAAWLWPVDHPFVHAATLRRLIDALGDHEVAQPRHGDRGGHPPLVARRLWPQLAACATLDGGARTVLAGADRIAVAVDDAGVVRDIDLPADARAMP
ncbi:MAG TPA: nucleotidyltransferase family protein [Kofleriaceae bacterium]|nr:nucleotidyltransferase family protein [Kofleriaceae bacterium]